MASIAFKFFLAIVMSTAVTWAQYDPSWDSLDTRPLPQWYDDAKFGIFIHWGVFSVPSYDDAWMWYDWQGPSPKQDVVDFMKANYPPNFTYQDFAPEFQAEFYDPNQWADIFAASGAKYVVLTSKHHEGYTLWPSSVSWSWNAKDVGPKRDLLGDLANAIRNKTTLRFGLYHSLYEWFNPIYISDQASGFTNGSNFPAYKTIPELYDIVNTYQPEVIWSDGDWDAPGSYWTSQEFIAWLYNESPVKDTVVTNDRWGSGVMCNHGDFYTCADRYNPGILQPHKWENCMTIDKYSWGYRRNAVLSEYMTIEELISTLASTVSCGGNLLMNVGPTEDGIIMPIFEERLRQIGQWLSINGEAIYGSKAWTYQNDTLTPNVWYTSQVAEDQTVTVYATVLNWPNDDYLQLGAPKVTGNTIIYLLGYPDAPLFWASDADVLNIKLPSLIPDQLPWAWVLKMEALQ